MTDTQPAGTPAADRPEPRWSGPDICQIPGEDGSPVCVRALEQRPCRTCPAHPEPSTPPAQQPHTAPAAAGPPPGTLDGPGVLGRALLAGGRLYQWVGSDTFWRGGLGEAYSRAELEADGPVREVLLADPAAIRPGSPQPAGGEDAA